MEEMMEVYPWLSIPHNREWIRCPAWKSRLARLLGKKVTGIDKTDSIRTEIEGYQWRGVIYVTNCRQTWTGYGE